jgi:hypothetical protein
MSFISDLTNDIGGPLKLPFSGGIPPTPFNNFTSNISLNHLNIPFAGGVPPTPFGNFSNAILDPVGFLRHFGNGVKGFFFALSGAIILFLGVNYILKDTINYSPLDSLINQIKSLSKTAGEAALAA